MTIEASKRGYAFASVRPRGDRDFETRTINLVFVVEEGPRAYIERINIRGNTRTRDYVIRREFDLAEGDAYNRALIDRAERRLKNLNYFKTVRSPTSRARRPIASSSMSTSRSSRPANSRSPAAIRPPTASWPKSASPSAICSAAANTPRPRCSTASAPAASSCRSPSRTSSATGSRSASTCSPRRHAGLELRVLRQRVIGGGTRLGFALREDLGLAAALLALSAARSRCRSSSTIASADRNPVAPGDACYADGEASLAVRRNWPHGPVMVSPVGYTLVYNTLDNNRTRPAACSPSSSRISPASAAT